MGNLSRKEFDVLNAMLSTKERLSQRRLEELTGYSLSTVNRTIRDLADKGLNLTRGRIIDGLIDACLAAGIDEIYIVRGYLAEQFDQLLYKYPMLHFLENPAYNDANNISSAVCARYLLQNAYVFEADLVISNPSIVTKYHYTSDFLGIRMDRSDDWCFTVKNGIITGQKVGGLDVYQEVGISYWDGEAGQQLSRDIPDIFRSPGGRERYWEQVPLVYRKEHYRVEIRECRDEDVVEIDTFSELKAIDKTYDV